MRNVTARQQEIFSQALLDSVRVVLVEPSHPGNIGAVARAMGNMGLTRLFLVQPRDFPHPAADARAAAAVPILDQSTVCACLDEALADCHLVVGTSARRRSIHWPELSPPEAMSQVAQESHRHDVALVFGRESSGLSNAELDRCDFLVRIPVVETCPSLNLAGAVLILTYELALAPQRAAATPLPVDRRRYASADQVQSFYGHLERVLLDIDFLKAKPPTKLMRKLKCLFRRARLSEEEINILRGILTAVEQRSAKRNG